MEILYSRRTVDSAPQPTGRNFWSLNDCPSTEADGAPSQSSTVA